MTQIGLMLYTVREDCARDFEGTLRAVAEIGYAGVELFDFHGHEPGDVRAWLDELDSQPSGATRRSTSSRRSSPSYRLRRKRSEHRESS